MMVMNNLLRFGAFASATTLFLAGCGSSSYERSADAHLVPDEPGIYAVVEDDRLRRLNGDREWENETWAWRSNLPRDVEFVVYDPNMPADASKQQGVSLHRVGWLRSEIDSTGDIRPIVRGSRWVVPETKASSVPLVIDNVAGRQDVVRATPRQSLDDGLYSLQLRAPRVSQNARIGVNWSSMDHDRYAARNCVDRYLGTDGDRLRPCGRQHEFLMGKDLQLHLVKPYRKTVDGVDRMVIQGVLANDGKQSRRVPPLTAELKNSAGQVIKTWRFVPEADRLAPGESVSFETMVEAPPAETETVTVNFGRTMTSEM